MGNPIFQRDIVQRLANHCYSCQVKLLQQFKVCQNTGVMLGLQGGNLQFITEKILKEFTGTGFAENILHAQTVDEDDFFAKQRIFLGGNRASRDPGRRNGGVMRNPNYTYADTRQPSPGDEGQQESPHLSI